jgi:Fe-S-cluster containining protein
MKVHLDVLGQEREVEARVRVGASRPVDVLPLARALANGITDAVVAAAAAEGRVPSCKAGCGGCCRQFLVPVAPVEAVSLARLVKAMPGKQRDMVRRRFGMAVRRLEDAGLLDREAPKGRAHLTVTPVPGKPLWQTMTERYRSVGVTCPFLDYERCTIHEDRPVACRQHLAVSPPELCTTDNGMRAEVLLRPVWMSEVLAELTAELGGHAPLAIPLPLALEWAEAHAASLDVEVRGEELAASLVERMQLAE